MITSSVVEVHEADVLLIVRICYNIYMATKNTINQATARATLTQIISVIFQRMEQNALEAAAVMRSFNAGQVVKNETVLNSIKTNHVKAQEVSSVFINFIVFIFYSLTIFQ